MLHKQNLIYSWNQCGVSAEKAEDRGDYCTEAIEEAMVGAQAHSLDSLETRGLPPCEKDLFVLSPDGRSPGNAGVRDGEKEGGRGQQQFWKGL